MERDLRARLRAHRLSETFVDRYAEDALQRGLVEYLRAREAGAEIREPTGFVLQAAFRRAIDELRREARTEEAAEVERLLDEGGEGAPSAEDVALEGMSAAELHAAIDSLPPEERQALCLHYFEELSDARSAKLLYCSERTFRRRLRKALSDLAELLGAPAPEPGSHRGLEIGLASWVSLRGARVVISSHPLEHLVAAIEGMHRGFTRAFDRLRSPAARLAGEGAPERIGTLAGGPAGKVIGGCAGAAVICAVSGVIGPGVQLAAGPTGEEHHHSQRTVAHHPSAPTRPLVIRPRPTVQAEPVHAAPRTSPRPAVRHPHRSASRAESTDERRTTHAPPGQTEERQVEEQFSGVAQAAAEAEAEAERSNTTSESTSVAQSEPAQSTAPAESTKASSEERQVEEQFRGPLAR